MRGAVDITELIGGYIDLRRQGRNYVGLCPWHDDSKPSLNVNPDRQSWKCWVCDIGGDVFSFVMRREGLEFVEALRFLADRAGIPLSRRGPRTKPGDPNDKQTLLAVLAWAEAQYRDCLLSQEGQAARGYLTDRGLTESCGDEFRVGYAPSGWQWLLDRARNTNYTESHLANVGLIGFSETSRRHYDRFRER
ncbi:MAG: CHC2 zinc finger domain-containing protein, partial [Planctomycetota bacterium]